MKNILARLAALAILAGCALFKTVPHYVPDPENADIVRAGIASPIRVGEFADASYRSELTCRSLAIIEAPANLTYADAIRQALIDELTQAGRYDPASPVTLTALLNRIDLETENCTWIIRMTLTSSNGKTMTVEETHTYNGTGFGEAACVQAAANYMPALKKFMKSLLRSPELAELARNTPPEAKQETFDTSPILNDEEEKAAETSAREAGRERVRQPGSLEPRAPYTGNP